MWNCWEIFIWVITTPTNCKLLYCVRAPRPHTCRPVRWWIQQHPPLVNFSSISEEPLKTLPWKPSWSTNSRAMGSWSALRSQVVIDRKPTKIVLYVVEFWSHTLREKQLLGLHLPWFRLRFAALYKWQLRANRHVVTLQPHMWNLCWYPWTRSWPPAVIGPLQRLIFHRSKLPLTKGLRCWGFSCDSVTHRKQFSKIRLLRNTASLRCH